jgi:hypothetical protein
MNITEDLKKPYWVRRVHDGYRDREPRVSRIANFYTYPTGQAEPGEIYLTEEDFLREIRQSAHKQMSDMQSSSPVWEQKTDPDDPTKKRWMIDHFDDVEVTTAGIQIRGANTFISHMSGKGFAVSNETKSETDAFEKLCSWKDSVGINTTAFTEICTSLAYTCEALIYQYKTNNNQDIEYKVFSYLNGDLIFKSVDENNDPVYKRRYTINGKIAIDVFTCKRVQTWVAYVEDDQKWWDAVKGWFNKASGLSAVGTKSEDGFVCVADAATSTPDHVNPCTYFRLPDLRSGDSQLNIESYEKAESLVAEEYKEDAFPDFLIKAEKIVSLPPKSKYGRRTYGVKGSADNLKASTAEYIKPADASNIAQLNLDTKWNEIKNAMMSVYIEPEILKSGADSSTTIKILFTPELQYCQLMWPYFFKPLKHMMNVFKELVGQVEGEPTKFSKLRVSIAPDFWIPNNTSEEIENTCKLVYAGILSQENARNYIDLQYINDSKIVNQEKELDLFRSTYVPLKAKAQAQKDFGLTDVADDVVVDKNGSSDGGNGGTSGGSESKGTQAQTGRKQDNNMNRANIANS